MYIWVVFNLLLFKNASVVNNPEHATMSYRDFKNKAWDFRDISCF